MLCNLILSLTTQPATVRKNTGLREQFALGGPFVQPASSACFRRFFSAAISAISRANFSLHTASVWTETVVPFVPRSLSGSREAGTLQFPEEPLVQGLHVVVHTCRLPCSATQHTQKQRIARAPAHRPADSAFFQETNSGTRNRLISQTPVLGSPLPHSPPEMRRGTACLSCNTCNTWAGPRTETESGWQSPRRCRHPWPQESHR